MITRISRRNGLRFTHPRHSLRRGFRYLLTSVAIGLVAYNAAVTKRTLEYLDGANDSDFDRIIDDSYDPPVSVGVRLVSVISDSLQHAGQARYLRGSIERLP